MATSFKVLRATIHRMFKALTMRVRGYQERGNAARFDVSAFWIEQEGLFQRAGLNFREAVQTTEEQFKTRARTDSSMHYEVAAALIAQKSVRKILEIGTQTGRFTRFVAELAADVLVTTIDLPPGNARFDNAGYQNIEMGDANKRESQTLLLRNENLFGLRNVTQLEMDSVRLINHHLTYDLVFVDGDHTYPIVVVDAINALRLVGTTGWILFDDLRPRNGATSEFGGSETTELLDLLESAGVLEVFRFHKRLEANRLYDPTTRKMIALARLRSPVNTDHLLESS